jgi:hypothetical protein
MEAITLMVMATTEDTAATTAGMAPTVREITEDTTEGDQDTKDKGLYYGSMPHHEPFASVRPYTRILFLSPSASKDTDCLPGPSTET